MRVSDVSILITQTKVTSWAKMEDLAWSPLSHSHSHSICRALGLTTPRWNLHNCISSAYLHFKRRFRFLSLSLSCYLSPSLSPLHTLAHSHAQILLLCVSVTGQAVRSCAPYQMVGALTTRSLVSSTCG